MASRRYYLEHREEVIAKVKAYRAANKEKVAAWVRDNKEHLRSYQRTAKRLSNYGLSEEAFLRLWDGQHGQCAICLRHMEIGKRGKTACHVDHNHKTGKVRGLLCGGCNPGLGWFEDSATICRRAAEYLEQTQ